MMMFFWVLRRVDWSVDANVSEKHTVSTFRAEVAWRDLYRVRGREGSTSQHRHFSPEDGDSIFLRNVGIYRRIYTTPNPEEHHLLTAVKTSNLPNLYIHTEIELRSYVVN
jgi:hypothetical protein